MLKSQGWVIGFPFIALLLIVVMGGLALTQPRVASAACSISSGNSGGWHAGFHKIGEDYTLSTRAIKSDIWNYNPTPVFDDVSLWVMIINPDRDRYAQIGWGKDDGDSVEYVFREYTDNDGDWHRDYYDASAATWGGSKATQPPSSKEYRMTWVYNNSTDHQLQFVYDNGTVGTKTVDWDVSDWAAEGEVHNFEVVSGTDKGDHSPGHEMGGEIKVHNMKLYGVNGGGWADPPSGYDDVEQANMGIDATSVTGIGFRIWDIRCDE